MRFKEFLQLLKRLKNYEYDAADVALVCGLFLFALVFSRRIKRHREALDRLFAPRRVDETQTRERAQEEELLPVAPR